MSIRLYVGNLPKDVEREELQNFFQDAGDLLSVKVITDRKTGKCRGFGFVTAKNDEQADQIVEAFNGKEFKESALKVEKAMPRKKGKEKPDSAPAAKPSSSGNRSNRSTSSTRSSSSESAQPDPRWADELSKLKQMLASQTTNS
ncbi:RNA-binding protein [Phormidium yuhuli AB48]|uniref:RNA-binding protein n=1 Tax=Phormidium yuhuli AB48 TaxID=2940671 RepID=A0ABY5AQ18_9CYAN|nr:RNA-binding protein [Phormidium yuhuli]USR90968.1 RNA-binding protein [Phormidium yuhuli AB48]